MSSSEWKNLNVKRYGIYLQKHLLKVSKHNFVLGFSFGRFLVVESLLKIILNEVKKYSQQS